MSHPVHTTSCGNLPCSGSGQSKNISVCHCISDFVLTVLSPSLETNTSSLCTFLVGIDLRMISDRAIYKHTNFSISISTERRFNGALVLYTCIRFTVLSAFTPVQDLPRLKPLCDYRMRSWQRRIQHHQRCCASQHHRSLCMWMRRRYDMTDARCTYQFGLVVSNIDLGLEQTLIFFLQVECHINGISNVVVRVEVDLDLVENVVLLQLGSNVLNSLEHLLSGVSIEHIWSDAVQEGVACGIRAQDTQGIDPKRGLSRNMLLVCVWLVGAPRHAAPCHLQE